MSGLIDFKNVFDRIPSPYMMLDPDLRYAAANRAYLAAVERRWEDLAGRYVFDAFPSDGENRRILEESLIRCRDSGQVDMLPLIEYAIQRPAHLGGGFEARIAVAYRSDNIVNVGNATQRTAADVYEAGRTVLDARVSYKLLKGVEIFGALSNITDAPLTYYQTNKNQTYSRQVYGFNSDFGVSVRF